MVMVCVPAGEFLMGSTDEEIDAERDRIRREFDLPACDVIHHGPDELVQAVLARKGEVGK